MRMLALLLGLFPLLIFTSPAKSDLLWGVNGHPFTAYPGITYRQQLELVKDLGMKSYRVNVAGLSHIPLLKKLVAEAKPLGIEILPVITPALNLKLEKPEDLYAKAFRLAVALVTPFKDDIRVWELGNELENFAIIEACEMRDNGEQYNCAWGPAGGVSPLDYHGPRWAKVSAVLKGLSDGTISVDPTIRKAMGTAGWGHLGAFERMHQDGIKWDISVWHMYGDKPDSSFQVLAKYGRPIWVTEFNNPFGSQRSEEEQAQGLAKQMTRLSELHAAYNIEAAHIYELLDESYWVPDYEAFMGLVRLEKSSSGRWKLGDPKSAYTLVKTMISEGNNNSQTPDGAALPATHAFTRRGCELDRVSSKSPISPEAKVDYAYCLILGRTADGAGRESWVAAMKNGTASLQVALAMVHSDEFARAHATSALDHPAFVSLMYRLLLDREPDGAGMSDYVDQLVRAESSRADVVRNIINSGEFRSKHPLLFAQPAHGTVEHDGSGQQQ